MQLIDPNHPMYRPLWVRVTVVAVCFAWAIGESMGTQPFWAVIAGALGVYAAWALLFNFAPQPPKDEAADAASSEESAEKPDDGEQK